MTRRLLIFPAAGLAAAILWTTLGTFTVASGQQKSSVIARAHTGELTPSFTRPIFLLMLGGDARKGNPSNVRTDSIHIVAINPVTMRASILGIPRDSYVAIPGHGRNKINAAGQFGGPDLVIQTVENLAKCRFDYYTLTSFQNFVKLVNDFGGISVKVPFAIHNPCCEHLNVNAGVQRMSGRIALAYARNRHNRSRGDFDRSVAQGQLLVSALAEAKADYRKDAGTALRDLGAMLRNLKLNIPLLEAFKLGLLTLRISPRNVTNQVVDGGSKTISGAGSIVQISQKGLGQLSRICSTAQL
jgi:polyisoprenyl-teichoic acid--peptidoglycan teichoic acid transferase